MNTVRSSAVCLRVEQPSDIIRIRHINELAFEGRVEADLIDALRATGGATLSVVAVLGGRGLGGESAAPADRSQMCSGEVVGGEVIGHALFTPVTVMMENREISLLGLGPVAVLPLRQHQGVGTLMIAGCLEHLRTSGHKGVVVVGEPGYYRRFGFIPAARWGLRWETDVPEENSMAMELTPGVLAGVSGVVRYRPEFTQS
jgi:putative acetyltransferase